MRRIDPRRRGRSWSSEKIFAPFESGAPALHVGMRIIFWECLEQKFHAFEHFSVRKNVRFRNDLILDSEVQISAAPAAGYFAFLFVIPLF